MAHRSPRSRRRRPPTRRTRPRGGTSRDEARAGPEDRPRHSPHSSTTSGLKPKDQTALDELASLYTRRASDYNTIWSNVLGQLQIIEPGGLFLPKATSPFGKAFANQDPITALVVARLNTQASAASQKLGLLSAKAESAYQRLVKVAPGNATYQFQYAEIAQSLGQKATAITAYKAFLKLAPNDALAPRARQELKALRSPPATKKKTSR